MRFRTVAASALVALSFACGGRSPAPPASPAAAPSATADAGAAVTAVAPPDLSPVPAPAKLMAVVTVKNAEVLQKSVRELAGAAFPMLQSITVDTAAQVFLGTAVADVVDLNQPIDVGVMAPQSVAVSLALSSIDDAKENLAEDFDLAPRDGGVIALTPRKGAENGKLHCEIRPSAGHSPYRLVCALHPVHLRELGPYLTRTVAREVPPADVRASFFVAALLAQEAGPSAADLAAGPAEAAGRAVGREGLADMDTFTMDATLGADAIDVSARSTFRTDKSPLTHFAKAYARDAKPLPDLFWRVPPDALGAVYAKGADPADLALVRKGLLEWTAPMLRKTGWTDATIESAQKTFSSLFLTGGPLAAAYGLDVPGALAAIRGETPKHHAPRSAFHGWFLFGVEEPSSRWVDGMRELMALARERHAAAANVDIPLRPLDTTTTRMSEAPVVDKKLPAHTAHFVWDEYPVVDGKVGRTASSTVHLYVVPDADRTWLALGENAPQVVAKVKEALTQTPDAGLARRAGLEALRVPTGLAGFVTPALFDAADAPEDAAKPTKTRELFDRLSATPDVEQTPVSFLVPGAPGTVDAVEMRALVPRAVVKVLLARLR